MSRTTERESVSSASEVVVNMASGLSPEPLYPQETQRRIDEVGHADIVVGIPSYNNARTIAQVVRAVVAGLAKYFPDRRAVLVNSDGGSEDGTTEAVTKTEVDLKTILVSHPANSLQKIVTPYHGIPGKGSAFRAIFEIAQRLGAEACLVVDSDLRSITPEWVDLLLRPVLKEGYDYVAPYYLRHKYDGTITNGIVYPLTRALYGQRVRQPIGGDFGFSGRLASVYLEKNVWASDVARYGIDIWMTTTAVTSGFKVCQSFLGAKIHDPKDPGADLAGMMSQVVGSVFLLMEEHANLWAKVSGSQPVPLFGFQYEVGLEPLHVNVERMVDHFKQGVSDLSPVWSSILGSGDMARLQEIAKSAVGEFHIPDELWARLIYDFACAHHRRAMNREHLLKSLIPLYMGRTASFVLETQTMGSREAEERIEALCGVFEQLKPYLIERWGEASRR